MKWYELTAFVKNLLVWIILLFEVWTWWSPLEPNGDKFTIFRKKLLFKSYKVEKADAIPCTPCSQFFSLSFFLIRRSKAKIVCISIQSTKSNIIIFIRLKPDQLLMQFVIRVTHLKRIHIRLQFDSTCKYQNINGEMKIENRKI